MKKVGKSVFFIVVLLIAGLTYLSFFGIYSEFGDITTTIIKGAKDIRWGIDIRGGVDVTFTPPEGIVATELELGMAKGVIEQRLVSQNITDYEVYTDNNKGRIIVRFPWKTDEADFNPEHAVMELGETALLTFREGTAFKDGYPEPSIDDPLILEGKHVIAAYWGIDAENNYVVQLELEPEGITLFAEATEKLAGIGYISIWMDDTLISSPLVDNPITDGGAVIKGNFNVRTAKELADKINSGALPFKLETHNYNTISPTLGTGARDAMLTAGVIAFLAVSVFMIVFYRLPGLIAGIALVGQTAGTIAALTGFFPVFNSFTLTLPGIAGKVLAIGMGMDANIISGERIREELRNGKTLDGAIDTGFKRAFTAIFDGNVTVIIIALILMGAFGPPSSAPAKMLGWLFFMFGPSAAGAIYSFGFTLLWGVMLNFVFGVLASRLMLKSITRFKPFRKDWMFRRRANV